MTTIIKDAADMFIEFKPSGDHLNGYVREAKRQPGSGKRNMAILKLGRVLDKERGIFFSKERGIYTYTIEAGPTEATDEILAEFSEHLNHAKTEIILRFGFSYIFDQAMKKIGLKNILQETFEEDFDSVISIVMSRIEYGVANQHIESYVKSSYAALLYPQARLASQQISNLYSRIGEEEVHRKFSSLYLPFLHKLSGQERHAVLIDSTGLANCINIPLTAVNVHYGAKNNEIRLIYIVDKALKLPIFFRYVPGNIVDVSTLDHTIKEMKMNGINIDECILDAGYLSIGGIKDLNNSKIQFIMRLKPNLKVYKELLTEHIPNLMTREFRVKFNERTLYVKKVETQIEDNNVYAYVCIDLNEFTKDLKVLEDVDPKQDGLTDSEYEQERLKCGVFMLLSSKSLDTNDVIPFYYSRQIVEQVFDTAKNYANLLPIRCHSVETFRGHLLISFITTAAITLLNQKLADYGNIHDAKAGLVNLFCKTYGNTVLVCEPDKRSKKIAEVLGLTIPKVISP